tara:strand:- start:12924 stop:13568 length:645 start_codon:yes stop_codon:yes gene_type:complete
MAVSMTYNSLLKDLRAYLERGTIVDTTVFEQLPSLINLAERQLAQELKILGFVQNVTDTLAIGQSVIPKPDRWRETISINFGVGVTQVRTPLFARSYEYIRRYWPDEDLTAQPKFYADYDYYNWLIGPSADAAYPFEVNYWELPALLDAVNQTNWTTDFAPNALLHGALLQATPFLKNDERIPTWQAIYDRDLGILQQQDLSRIIDRNVTRENV